MRRGSSNSRSWPGELTTPGSQSSHVDHFIQPAWEPQSLSVQKFAALVFSKMSRFENPMLKNNPFKNKKSIHRTHLRSSLHHTGTPRVPYSHSVGKGIAVHLRFPSTIFSMRIQWWVVEDSHHWNFCFSSFSSVLVKSQTDNDHCRHRLIFTIFRLCHLWTFQNEKQQLKDIKNISPTKQHENTAIRDFLSCEGFVSEIDLSSTLAYWFENFIMVSMVFLDNPMFECNEGCNNMREKLCGKFSISMYFLYFGSYASCTSTSSSFWLQTMCSRWLSYGPQLSLFVFVLWKHRVS